MVKYYFSFALKKNLKEFWKSVHPDTLSFAPKKVKEENVRSLKLLNNYLDDLKANKGCKSLFLKFYAPNKDNKKSKKFLYFETNLSSISPNLEENDKDLFYQKQVQKLITNLKSVQLANNPMKVQDNQEKTDPNDIQNLVKNRPQIMIRSTNKTKQIKQYDNFMQRILEHQKNQQDQIIKENIKRNLQQEYFGLNLYEQYGEEIHSQLTGNALYNKMNSLKMNPKIFYISESLLELNNSVVDFFIKLLKWIKIPENNQRFQNLQNLLLQQNPPVKIMLDVEKKILKGFIKIDITEDVEKSLSFVSENYNEAQDKRQNLNSKKEYIEQLVQGIIKNTGLQDIKLIDCDGNTEQTNLRNFLFLKKLEQISIDLIQLFPIKILQNYTIEIRDKNDTNKDTKYIQLRWDFNPEKELPKLLRLFK